MGEAAVFIFSLIILILCIGNICQFILNSKLKKINERIVKSNTTLTDISIDDRVLVLNYQIEYMGGSHKGHKFSIEFEGKIVDVSKSKVKVEISDFKTDDTITIGLPKSNVINFINEQWIDKSKVEPIIDEYKVRDDKINRILE